MKRMILPLLSLAALGGFAQTDAEAAGAPTSCVSCQEQDDSHLVWLKHGKTDVVKCPEQECRTAKKTCYEPLYRTVCVAVPEVRYRYKMMCIIKKSDAKCTMPACEKDGEPSCSTKTIDVDTTQKVKYWTCVKVPYTVYHQVQKCVCVKKPCTVDVPVVVNRTKCVHGRANDCCEGCAAK